MRALVHRGPRAAGTVLAIAALGLTGAACQAPPAAPAVNDCGTGTVNVGGTCVLSMTGVDDAALELACGEGTELIAGKCELTTEALGSECGAGTRLMDGACVAVRADGDGTDLRASDDVEPPRTCGHGTLERDGFCVRDDSDLLTCGPGTREQDGVCVSFGLGCGLGTHVQQGRCVRDVAPLYCGPGTRVEAGVCFPEYPITCATGTVEVDGECVPEFANMECGDGTELLDNQCVVNDEVVMCGEGTVLVEGVCVLDEEWTPCGYGTIEVEGDCVRDDSSPLAHSYELRIPVDTIPADGLSHVPLTAYGRNADGEPSTAAVVVWADREGVGSVRPGITTLEQAGRRFWFIPCSARQQGCTGPVRFHMALAADPEHILASTPEVEITAAGGVATMAPCLQGGNVFFTTGHPDHPVVRRTKFLQRAAYSIRPQREPGGALGMEIYPDDHDDGQRWEVTVGSSEPGVHLDSDMSIQLNGPVCNGGKFQIHSIDVDWNNPDGLGHISALEASWKVECLDPGLEPYPTLVGCIRIDPDDTRALANP